MRLSLLRTLRSASALRGALRSAFLLAALCLAGATEGLAQSPKDAVDQLLAADRKFAESGEKAGLIEGLVAMFADSVAVGLPNGTFARTRDEARAALVANPGNRGARVSWYPVRGGLSADGLHGFTLGYMKVTTDSAVSPAKYLAYWVRGANGWRVAGYKRIRAAADPPTVMLPAFVPPAIRAGSADVQHDAMRSVIAAEKQFSDSSQKIGLGPAFAIFGRADATNAGPATAPAFVVGAAEIAKSIGRGALPGTLSPVNWSADFAIVAASGDLAITFGVIRQNDPAAAGPGIPFFTIWSRPGAKGEWRYIAE